MGLENFVSCPIFVRTLRQEGGEDSRCFPWVPNELVKIWLIFYDTLWSRYYFLIPTFSNRVCPILLLLLPFWARHRNRRQEKDVYFYSSPVTLMLTWAYRTLNQARLSTTLWSPVSFPPSFPRNHRWRTEQTMWIKSISIVVVAAAGSRCLCPLVLRGNHDGKKCQREKRKSISQTVYESSSVVICILANKTWDMDHLAGGTQCSLTVCFFRWQTRNWFCTQISTNKVKHLEAFFFSAVVLHTK